MHIAMYVNSSVLYYRIHITENLIMKLYLTLSMCDYFNVNSLNILFM